MEAIALEIKPNDVFRFRYNKTERDWTGWDSRYHCFDGTLKARQRLDGSITLHDTYWGESGMSRWFTPEDALESGTLEFVCNLDDVDPIKKRDLIYYDDEDVFTLYIHSGYQNEYYLRRGAERSQAKMLSVLDDREEDARSKIRSAQHDLQMIAETRAKIEAGDTSIYL